MTPTKDPQEVKREAECPARHHGTCISLNILLGWSCMCPMPMCDTCKSKGGLLGREGEAFRQSKAKEIVANFSRPEQWPNLKRSVLVPLTLHHKTIPMEALSQEGEVAKALFREASWESVKSTWETATDWVATMTSFTRSMASRGVLDRRCSDEDRNLRNISCFGVSLTGEVLKPPCPWVAKSPSGYHYCSACGCGDRKVARLDDPPSDKPKDPGTSYVKLDYPYLECPRRLAGFSNAAK